MAVKRLEKVVNVALVVVAAVFLISVASSFIFKKPAMADKALQVGSMVSLPDIEWKSHNRTVIFALNRECKYCTESAPFFRKLLKAISNEKGINTLAVFPHAPSEGEKYLKDIHVKVNSVVQADLNNIGIVGSPTLVIVDGSGKVTRAWLGQLDIIQQQEVFDYLGLQDADVVTASPDDGISLISVATLNLMMDKGQPVVILDLESREAYKREHIPGAINIPSDEVEARAEDELSRSAAIILYEHSTGTMLGQSASKVLEAAGFKQILILQGGLQSWAKAHPSIAKTLPVPNDSPK